MTANGSGAVSWAVFSELVERVRALEEKHARESEGSQARRSRLWLLVMAVMTGLVCPIVVTTIIAWLHLRGG